MGDAFFSAEGGGAGGDQRDGSDGGRENGGQVPRVRGSGGRADVDVDEEVTLGPFILGGAGDEVMKVEVTEGLLD